MFDTNNFLLVESSFLIHEEKILILIKREWDFIFLFILKKEKNIIFIKIWRRLSNLDFFFYLNCGNMRSIKYFHFLFIPKTKKNNNFFSFLFCNTRSKNIKILIYNVQKKEQKKNNTEYIRGNSRLFQVKDIDVLGFCIVYKARELFSSSLWLFLTHNKFFFLFNIQQIKCPWGRL